jgi:tetratricopeptide (TPR) repeat protein
VEHASEENRTWHARFPRALACLCVAAAGLRAVILFEQLADNPFALVPYSDAEHYWRMAADFAAGRGPGETPFLVAPLHPLLLALLRMLGGGLPTLYLLQTGLHLATAAERHYRRALDARAGFAPAAGALYNLEIARGRWADARETLGALVRAAPADAEAQLAAAWLLAGVPDPALRSADAALVHVGEAERLLGPDRTDFLLARTLALAGSGRSDEAIRATGHGEALARARGEQEVARSFASLREPLRSGREIAAPPPRLRIALGAPDAHHR